MSDVNLVNVKETAEKFPTANLVALADDMSTIGVDTVAIEAEKYLEERQLLLGMSRSTKKGISMWCSEAWNDYCVLKNLKPVVRQVIRMVVVLLVECLMVWIREWFYWISSWRRI